MRYQVHALTGAAVSGIVCRALPANDMTLGLITAGMVLGSVIPDIDSTKSKVASAGLISTAVSILAETTLGHRGFFHTPCCLIMLTGIWLELLSKYSASLGPMLLVYHFGLSFLVGYALHILVDSLNPYGIMLFYPLSKERFSFKWGFKMGSTQEKQMFAILLLLCAFLYIVPRRMFGFEIEIREMVRNLLMGSKYYIFTVK